MITLHLKSPFYLSQKVTINVFIIGGRQICSIHIRQGSGKTPMVFEVKRFLFKVTVFTLGLRKPRRMNILATVIYLKARCL